MSSVRKQNVPSPRQHHPGSSEARRRLATMVPLAENVRRIKGVPTAVFEGGEGPSVVLLHSVGEFAAVWQPVIHELMRTHHLVIPDLPGQGASETVDEYLDADGVLQWLDELIDQTCDSPPALVGHLLGGAIAARYAVDQKQGISRLVLVDSLGLEWYRPSLRFAVPMMGFIARPSAKSRDRLFDQCFLDRDQVRSRTGEDWKVLMDYALDRARTPSVQVAGRRLMSKLGVPPIRSESLSRIHVPTTLIHGRHDLQVRLKTAEETAARYGWTLHVIEDCRDDPAIEQPSAFLRALHQALEST